MLVNAQSTSSSSVVTSNEEALQLFNAGVAASQKHDNSTAAKDFQAAIEKDPNLAEAHCNYGHILLRDGKYEEALPELIKARDLKPTLTSTWSSLGACYQSLGKTSEAIAAYQKCLELEPKGQNATQVKNVVQVLSAEAARANKSSVTNGASDYLGDATQNGAVRWPAARMPIKIYIEPGKDVPNYQPSYETVLRKSFQEWLDAAGERIKFQFIDNKSGAQLTVSWTNNPKEMVSAVEGGHAMVSPDTEGIARSHIYLLTIRPDDGGALTDNQAHRVDLHEIGHSLGIFGHSHDPSDIMFGSMPTGDRECLLSTKDKNTLNALYDMDAAALAKNPLSQSEDLIAGDPNSNVVKATKLNDEAVLAMRNKNFVLAAQKFEQAHKLDPSNELFSENLGIAYGNCALAMMMFGNVQQANEYFNRALPLAEKSSNKAYQIAVLKNYFVFCKASKRDAEATKTEIRLKALGAL
jgi:tetratricopeptide (TPR) repeat protein